MDKVTDQVFTYIDAIAEKLGVASEHVYGLLVKQQVLNGVNNILLAIFIGVLVYLVYRSVVKPAIKSLNEPKERFFSYTSDTDELKIGFGVGTMLILAFVMVAFLLLGIKMLVNPEYYAIQEIVKAIK